MSLTPPFVFRERGIETARGACLAHGGRDLLITYGVREAEAWICRVPLAEVESRLQRFSIIEGIFDPPTTRRPQ